jgi:beta-xylosidase
MNAVPMPTAISPAAARAIAYPWSPDQGDGTYCNPILCADYSDPDVVRHGEDFYLTASSFNCTPGLPILHSRDLVNWTIIGHAIKNLPHPRYQEVQPGCGVWAPSIRFHAGKFWVFFPTPDEGIFITTAKSPAGPWSEPHLLEPGKGLIDPCPLWDEDGKAYLVHAYAGSRAGIKHMLRVRPMAPDGSRLLGDGQVVFHNPERHPTLEGPKFLKKDGWYYILAPAGGVATGWQVAFRSRNIYGPYEDRIVLERGSTSINGPHQGALVDAVDGNWWFAHFQDTDCYGRIVHLQPVTWKDGWPLIGEDHDGNGIGEPVARHRLPKVENQPVVPQTSDEFESPTLDLQWQWHANHKDDWYSLSARPGWLRFFAQPVAAADLAKAPTLLLQKFPARAFEAETLLDFSSLQSGEEAGLTVVGQTHAAVAVRRQGAENEVVYRENGKDQVLVRADSNRICLRVSISEGGKCTFRFSEGDCEATSVPIAFQATAGVWIGAKVGLYSLSQSKASGGYADFDYFRFSA